jgi:hypothetical protein
MFGRIGKVYNGTPKVKDLKRGSIQNLRDAAVKEEQKKKEGKRP